MYLHVLFVFGFVLFHVSSREPGHVETSADLGATYLTCLGKFTIRKGGVSAPYHKYLQS